MALPRYEVSENEVITVPIAEWRRYMIGVSEIGRCEGCGSHIPPFRDDVYSCLYCGEEYQRGKKLYDVTRVSTTPLPLIYVQRIRKQDYVDDESSDMEWVVEETTHDLRDIVKRYKDAKAAHEEATKELQAASVLYGKAMQNVR